MSNVQEKAFLGELRMQFSHSRNTHTLPEINIAPENGPLEKEIPIGNHHFQVLC